LARTLYIRCIYGVFGREITKFTVMYGAYIHGSGTPLTKVIRHRTRSRWTERYRLVLLLTMTMSCTFSKPGIPAPVHLWTNHTYGLRMEGIWNWKAYSQSTAWTNHMHGLKVEGIWKWKVYSQSTAWNNYTYGLKVEGIWKWKVYSQSTDPSLKLKPLSLCHRESLHINPCKSVIVHSCT